MKRIAGFFGRLFGQIFFLINLVAVLWLFLCYFASVTSPTQAPYLALASLTTPFAIIVNALFALIWLFTSRKWRAIPSVVLLVFMYRLVASVFGLNFFTKNDLNPGEGKLKVMTWNVHGLGIYDRPVDKSVPQRIMQLIKEEQPDVLCLQEFYTDWKDAMKPYSDYFLKEGGFREYRFSYDNTLGTKIYVGTALYSRYPVHNMKEIEIAEHIKMMHCDLELPDGQMVRAYFIHLQSFLLLDKDKKFIEEMKSRREVYIPREVSENYARQFKKAYVKRAIQSERVAESIAESPYPVIVCGDLNDLPGSYTYTTIKGELKDAFAQGGRGLGRTYNGILPTLRIDYIMYHPSKFKIAGFKSPRTSLSDHNPVIANFRLLPGTRLPASTDDGRVLHNGHSDSSETRVYPAR